MLLVKSKAILIMLVPVATLMLTCAGSAQAFGIGNTTNATVWHDFGNFGTILGFKANFHTGLAYNGSGVFVPWSKICTPGQKYLVQPCSALIDSNGVLTDAGNHAVHCIRNGVVLGVVAIKLGLPINLAKSIIGGLAGMTGCNGIVDMNKIQLSNETQFLVRNIGQ